jgi:hypothetical protein
MSNFYRLETHPILKHESVEDGLDKYAWLMISLWGIFYVSSVLF